jgi:hypothetical protein
MNWYLRLDDATSVGVTPTEINNLQRWSECKAGYTDPAQWCNFLTETLPQGGNYGMWDPATYDWNPTNDQPQLPNPCLDYDYGNPNATQGNPCKGKNMRVAYTGARVFDNNHGWKEIHPVRKEAWTGSSSSGCYSVNETNQASPNTCTDTVPAASSGTGSTTYSQVVDNADPSRFYVNSKGNWYTSSSNSQRYGPDYRYHWATNSGYYAYYMVNTPTAANYKVYAWWPASSSNNSSTAYWIWTTNGWAKKNVDQRTNGGQWVDLGTYAMPGADDWDIEVDYGYYSSKTGYIMADAVQVVRQ